MNHYNPTLQDIRDFIGRSRNTLATQLMSMQNLKNQMFPDVNNVNNFKVEDDDFEVPLYVSDKDRLDRIINLNLEMFDWIKLLSDYDLKDKIDYTNLDMPLGDRMKLYEKKFQTYINEKENIVIRLDGDSFSKFTQGFKKPFDTILTETMIRTTKDLFKRFSCAFAYTQSDEITLIIPKTKEMILGGKVQKLVSLSAGFCSTKFNYNLEKVLKENKELISEEYYNFILEKKVGQAWFDSRIFGIEDEVEVFNAFLFRARDAERNSISMLAFSNFSHNALLNLNSEQKKELLLEKDISWDDLDDGLKYGFCFKREQFINEQNATRTRIKTFAKKFHFSDENVDLLIRSFY